MSMEKNEKEFLKPHFFSKDDPRNPKNIDAEKELEKTKKRMKEKLENKKIVIDDKEV